MTTLALQTEKGSYRIFIHIFGCLATSINLGILEASRMILWTYGFSNSMWSDGANYILTSTILNLPLAIGVFYLGLWGFRKTTRGKKFTRSSRSDLLIFLVTYLTLAPILIVARGLIFLLPAAALLFLVLLKLLSRLSTKSLGVIAGLICLVSMVGALTGIWKLPNVPHDYERLNMKRKGPLRTIKEPRNRYPHILFILVDTLRPDHLPLYGYPRQTTPTLNKLAREGINFTEFRANSNETSQSMASLLTGKYPSGHGLLTLGESIPKKNLLLTEIFQGIGYNTTFFTSHWYIDDRHEFQKGVDYFYSAWDQLPMRFSGVQNLFVWRKLSAISPQISNWLKWLDTKKNDYLIPWLGLYSMESAERITDKLVGYVDHSTGKAEYNSQENRFFTFIFFHDLHWPRCLPRPYHTMFDPDYRGPEICRKLAIHQGKSLENEIARYDGAIRFVDDQIARILKKFQDSGWLKDTLVIVAADHGEKFGEKGEYGHGAGFWEELVRIPLILWWPSRWNRGHAVKGTAEQVDLLPSLLDLLMIPHPPGVQGKSLVDFKGQFPLSTGRTTSFGESENENGKRWLYVTKDDWKLMIDTAGNKTLLNLRADPDELVNLYGSQPETRELENYLRQRSTELRKAP